MRSRGRGSNQGWDWARMSESCRRLARRYGARCDAEDIAQEALIRAWRFRGAIERDERLDAWLATIVRNEAARQRSRPLPEPVPEIDQRGALEDERLTAIAASADLAYAIGRLDPDERLLIELRYTRDLTQPAIARALELPEGTVKVRLHRARSKLREALS